MEEKKLTLSVIIPNYNNEKYLGCCIDSVLQQTYPIHEVIIVDDCSTDDSHSLMKVYASKYSNIKPIFLSENTGVSNARNTGIGCATGEYITTLDGDDFYINPHKLENEMSQAACYLQQGKDSISYSRVVHVDENGSRKPFRPSKEQYAEGNIYEWALSTNYFSVLPRDYCVRKETILQAGGYDVSMNMYEDYELVLRLAQKTFFYFTDEEGIGYRIKETGLSNRPLRDGDKVVFQIFYKYLKFLPVNRQLTCIIKKLSSHVYRRLKEYLRRFIRKFIK